MMEILQGRQEKLLLSEKGKRDGEFHLAVLPKMDSQGPFRTWLKKQTSRETKVTSRGDWIIL